MLQVLPPSLQLVLWLPLVLLVLGWCCCCGARCPGRGERGGVRGAQRMWDEPASTHALYETSWTSYSMFTKALQSMVPSAVESITGGHGGWGKHDARHGGENVEGRMGWG